MESLLLVYLQNSLALCVVALLLFAFSPLLERRYTARFRFYLWGVIFAALVLPVRVKITLSLPQALQPLLPQNLGGALPGTGAAFAIQSFHWFHYAALLWGAGVLCFFVWHFYQHLRFLSAVRRWSEEITQPAVLTQFLCAKQNLKIRKSIDIKSCACVQTPMVIGLFHPAILLPHTNIPTDELPLILKHELVHYQRKDLWYKALMLTACAIHWFNPVVHLMVRSALNLCEISCDERVLQGYGTRIRAQYGQAIIGVARGSSPYRTALSSNFYNGAKGIKKRIYAMMELPKKRFSPVLFLLIFMVALGGTTAFALSPTPAGQLLQPLAGAASTTTNKNNQSSSDLAAPLASAFDEKQNDQTAPAIDALTNQIVPDLQPTAEITPQKQQTEPVDAQGDAKLVATPQHGEALPQR